MWPYLAKKSRTNIVTLTSYLDYLFQNWGKYLDIFKIIVYSSNKIKYIRDQNFLLNTRSQFY